MSWRNFHVARCRTRIARPGGQRPRRRACRSHRADQRPAARARQRRRSGCEMSCAASKADVCAAGLLRPDVAAAHTLVAKRGLASPSRVAHSVAGAVFRVGHDATSRAPIWSIHPWMEPDPGPDSRRLPTPHAAAHLRGGFGVGNRSDDVGSRRLRLLLAPGTRMRSNACQRVCGSDPDDRERLPSRHERDNMAPSAR